jgi:hypothetical protein
MSTSLAGTYAVEVRPLRPAERRGTLVLRSDDPELDGTFVYVPTDIADCARKLATPTVTLNRHGNVVSVQDADGRRRTKFPKGA